MRIIILIFFSISSFEHTLFCQNLNDTIILNKFIGTWRWTNHTDTFDVKLIKDTIPKVMTNSVTYNIYGFHKLIEKGRLVENSFSDTKKFLLSEATIVGTNLNDTTLNLIVIDKYRHKSYLINLTLEKEPTRAIWKKIKDQERIQYITKSQRINTPKPLSSKVIPTNVILNKVCN